MMRIVYFASNGARIQKRLMVWVGIKTKDRNRGVIHVSVETSITSKGG